MESKIRHGQRRFIILAHFALCKTGDGLLCRWSQHSGHAQETLGKSDLSLKLRVKGCAQAPLALPSPDYLPV